MRTLIKGTWIVAHGENGHELIRDGVLFIEGDRVAYIGNKFSEPVDTVIDATDKLVCPGFIDSHVHSGHRALHRLMSDTGRPELLGQPFYETALRHPSQAGVDGRSAVGDLDLQAEFTVAELLRNGITSFVEFGSNAKVLEAVARHAERLGIRAWLGCGFESYRWVSDSNGRRVRKDELAEGDHGLKEAVSHVHAMRARNSRLDGLLVPRDTDTCSLDLLRRSSDAAEQAGCLVAIHAAYNPWEFYHVLQEHGCTPLELLDKAGLLRSGVILGHCNFISEDGRMHHPGGRDLALLARSGATVSHCPVNLIRRGRVLDHWTKYRANGIAIALGTDTYPRDMIEQMRVASYMAKAVSRNLFSAPAQEVFDAATIVGARMLGREDLGRLQPGAKADLAIIKLQPEGSLRFGPIRDPIRALVECGIGDNVDTVMVDGRICVQDGKVIGSDLERLRSAAQSEADGLWAGIRSWDPLGRTADERSPMSYPRR